MVTKRRQHLATDTSSVNDWGDIKDSGVSLTMMKDSMLTANRTTETNEEATVYIAVMDTSRGTRESNHLSSKTRSHFTVDPKTHSQSSQ